MSRDVPVKHGLNGNLDMDSDPRNVREGNYMSAMDIIKQDDAGGVSGTVQPTQRNKHAFSLGSVQAQNKRYRITVDGDATKNHSIKFLSTKRDYRITTGTGPNGEVEFVGTVASLSAAFLASNLPGAFSTSVSGNSVEFELTNYPHYQWYIEGYGPDDVSIVCIQEAIPTDLAGPLKDIGSHDLMGDLFVFSTTQDELPTELDIEVISVGPIQLGLVAGPLTAVTFNDDHGLQAGQWIRITGSQAAWLSGLFVVFDIPSATSIRIVTDTAWGATHTPLTSFTETISIHPSGLGEIGVGVNDVNTDSWTYTRLLRSVELNFVSRMPISCDAEKGIDEAAVYFDDDYNPYRAFYYIGDYVLDGALLAANPANIYSYGSIAVQVYGFEGAANISVDFVSQSAFGGVLESGNYRYFVVLKDYSGNDTSPSDLSNLVVVYSDPQNALAVGDDTGTATTKSNNILVSGINTSVYEKIAIGYYSIVGGVGVASLLPFDFVSSDQYEYRHTGLEEEVAYDVGIFAGKSIGNYEFAKTVNIIDQRVVRSNLRKKNLPDLAAFFKTIKHAVCVEDDLTANGAPAASNSAGEFKDPSNVFYKSGYMFNETYRFSGRVIFKDGSVSDWYWVDDIRVDPFLTNQANPNDNRRDQSVPNAATSFDLVRNTPGTAPVTTGHIRPSGSYFDNQGQAVSNPQNGEEQFMSNDSLFSHKNILVPYIEFFDIDPSYTINGQPLSGLVEYVEFGRSEVVKEVMATGVAVGSVKLLTTQEVPMGIDDNPAVGGVYRSFPLFGLFTLSFTNPTVNLGIGTRTSDLDGANETYHEYPFVYSGFPISGVTQGNITPSTSFATEVINFFANSFVIDWAQPLGDWINVLMGINFQNNSANPFPDTNSALYPSTNSTDFYRNDLVETNQLTGIGTPFKRPNFHNTMRSERRIWTIYSPDLIFGNEDGSGSIIIDFGEMFLDPTQTANSFHTRGSASMNNTHLPSCVTRYYPENLLDTYNEYVIDEMREVSDGERVNLFGFSGFRKAHDAYIFSDMGFFGGGSGPKRKGINALWNMIKSPVVHIENGGNGITSQGKNSDHAIRYVQLFTKKDNKYGPVEESTYYSTGTKIDITGFVGPIGHSIVKVFGGDTFTQQSYLKTKYADYSVAPGAGPDPDWDHTDTNFPADSGPGFSGGLFVYTQNRRNSQLRYDNPDQFTYLKDTTSLGEWAWDFEFIDRHTYSSIYDSLSNSNIVQINGNAEFDLSKFEFPTRLTWSQRKIYGEKIDSYRAFYPLDIKDLTLAFGEIHHHDNINGELFTIQPRKFQLQYFNARGTLEASSSGAEVIIGDGSVLARDGQTLSAYGTRHKWSAVRGRSQAGKDVLYWFNQENGLIMRFGADGTRVLSDHHHARAFFANNTKWTEGVDIPAHSYGVRSVWDDRFKEAIWTFTGVREVPEYTPPGLLTPTALEGTVVSNPNAPIDTFEELPRLFRATDTHPSFPQNEPGVGSDWEQHWEQIPYEDKEYYSVFTLAYNELTGGFSTFYNHLPKTYLKWKNKFLSSHPVHRSEIYEHRRGYDDWYTFEGVGKPAQAYIEPVINALPEATKKFIAVQALATAAPDRVEFKTENHESFLEAIEYERNDDGWRSPIKQDSTVTGDPTTGEESLFGSYIRAKLIWNNGSTNRIHNFIVKVRERLRRYTV